MQLELAFLERRPVDPDDGSNGPVGPDRSAGSDRRTCASFAADRAKAGGKGQRGRAAMNEATQDNLQPSRPCGDCLSAPIQRGSSRAQSRVQPIDNTPW